jgi:hypothetical protein
MPLCYVVLSYYVLCVFLIIFIFSLFTFSVLVCFLSTMLVGNFASCIYLYVMFVLNVITNIYTVLHL